MTEVPRIDAIRKLVGKLGRRLGARSHSPEVYAIQAAGIFDLEGYLQKYPDVTAAGLDPIVHYVESGALEGRNPCEFFDSAYYLGTNPDVAAAGINPLFHFCEFGWKESRHPSPDFDVDWYARTHLAHTGGQMNPLMHYLTAGRAMGLEVQSVKDPEAEIIRESGVFDAEYYLGQYPDVMETGIDPIAHYLRYGAAEGRNPSAMFDTRYYLKNNRDIAWQRVNPLLHFCQTGWKELRNPSREFDVWWYWSTHLDPAKEGDNPLGHYQSVGRAEGLDTRPPARLSQLAGSGHRHAVDAQIRRVCLFAAYDRDGVVDDYVLAYLRELSRYADIYYLADSDMRPGELDKLAPYTQGAWAERHGEYDFGSYSRLIRHVGWDTIERYDELLFVNDSCYLLRSLDEVFARMDEKACDWWGLQATKGIAATRRNPANQFRQPIPMEVVRGSLLDTFERDYRYDFLVGSYFVAYRRPVIEDGEFRRLLDSVTAQESKRNVILKYEVGLTRHLIARGYAFDTFVGSLYPFHPIFTNWYFRLLDEGFPLLKRYFLAENHYAVRGLSHWAERIRQKVPEADTEVIERHLERVVDPEKLHRNLHLGSDRLIDDGPPADELLDDVAFLAADQSSPKYGHWWAFPTCAFTGVFSGNERAVFEEVKNDPLIRKIVLTRDKPIEVDGLNVEVVPLESPLGQHRLMRAGNIFIKHSPARNLVFPVASELHNIINLWHGIPFKRIGYASADMQQRLGEIASQHAKCRAVISSSKVDTLAMATAFYPLSYGDVWNTGLPRNDFILRVPDLLPADMRAQADRLDDMLDGRRLVLFMPTFRNAQEDGYYRFTDEEKGFLKHWLERNGAVLGMREHMADSARAYSHQLGELGTLDLSDAMFPNVEVLYRASAALITDYSSCFIDYMLTGKPAVSFAYDHDSYLGMERGAFYDLDFVFPGPVCRTFSQLRTALESLFAHADPAVLASLEWKRRLFFDHVDDQSSARVVARVKQITDCDGVGLSQVRGG
jgi:CDP-glycerol glycerophosphotransferase (TagB/SpsB family)